jgi:hypothetical protein
MGGVDGKNLKKVSQTKRSMKSDSEEPIFFIVLIQAYTFQNHLASVKRFQS